MQMYRFDHLVRVYSTLNPLCLYFLNVPYPYLSNSSCFDSAVVVFPFSDSFAGDCFVFVVEMDR
jgi:hypothetical protein